MTSIIWFRRDLRVYDHRVIEKALASSDEVLPVFIFDTDILKDFSNPSDRRLSFIAESLALMNKELKKYNGKILALHGRAEELIPKLAMKLQVKNVYAAEDFEPKTIERDKNVASQLEKMGAKLLLCLDHLIQHPNSLLKDDNTPFKVFTPFSRKWYRGLRYEDYEEAKFDLSARFKAFDKIEGFNILDTDNPRELLENIGYKYQVLDYFHPKDARNRLHDFIENKLISYGSNRDILYGDHTSGISPYLRFGNISIREALRLSIDVPGAAQWVNELIWREFYAAILYFFPETVDLEFQVKYRNTLKWEYNDDLVTKFKEAKTGFPIIDAAVNQLKTTGWMHNRARMIVASFFTKDLLQDWRVGEKFFAEYLMDYELASNVGGWQWASSTGTDAQPYFRVFNPFLQSKKCDPDGDYIKEYVPKLRNMKSYEIHEPHPADYMKQIVDHAMASKRAIRFYKDVGAI